MSAELWNKFCPPGTQVLYFPVLGVEEHVETCTRSEAWNVGDNTPVVMVQGKSGGVALRNIMVLPRAPKEVV